MKPIVYLLTLLCGLWTIGCASVLPPVPLDPAFWKDTKPTIAVAMTAIPKPKTTKTGSQGLLDMAVNEAMGSELDAHLNALDVSSFKQMQETFRERLVANGFSVKDMQDPINVDNLVDFEGPSGAVHYMDKDFRRLKQQLGVDKLLLLEVIYIGTMRRYYGFVPLEDPTIHCSARGTLIDLSDNRVLWHHSELRISNVPDPWDQGPAFPNLTRTLGNAMMKVQTSIPRIFFAGAPKGLQAAPPPVKVAGEKAPAVRPDDFGDAFGFVFGTSKAEAAAACQKARHQWRDDEKVSHCSGTPSTVLSGVSTQIEFDDGKLVAVEFLLTPPNDVAGWTGMFTQTESALNTFYDKPMDRNFVVPDACRPEASFLACIADGKVDGSASWHVDEAHTAILTIVPMPLPATSMLRIRIGRPQPKS